MHEGTTEAMHLEVDQDFELISEWRAEATTSLAAVFWADGA